MVLLEKLIYTKDMEDDTNATEKTKNQTRVLSREVFFKGKTIIEQGDDANRAYYIEEGRVEVLVNDGDVELKVSELGPRNIFGEMALIEDGTRTASIRVLEDCTVTIISRDELNNRVENVDNKAIKALIEILIGRLRQTTKSQLKHYKNLMAFRDRVADIAKRAEETLEEKKRETFREEIKPILQDLQNILDGYEIPEL